MKRINTKLSTISGKSSQNKNGDGEKDDSST